MNSFRFAEMNAKKLEVTVPKHEKLATQKSTGETELEKKRFDGALRRRQLSLILAGKLKAKDASELKALFK